MKNSPQFWIEELRILRTWSLDPEAEVRRIEFRRGLNIIWAQASLSDEQELPGFGGHAAGKTSLCRLLRFVLGEKPYGSRFMKDRIFKTFPDGWVVAKIWVADKPWIVGRPFSGLNPKSCPADSIEAILNTEVQPGPYDDFRQVMHTAVLGGFPLCDFPSEEESITFGHLLEWLARDQECRLSGLLEWRHPSSDSLSPGMSAAQRRFLIRATLDLIDETVRQEIEKRHKLETDLAKIPDDIVFQRRSLREHLAAVRKAMGSEDLPDVGESLFVDTVKRLAINRRDQEFKPIDQKIHSLNLTQHRAKQDRLNQDLGARRFQEKDLKDHLANLELRFTEAQQNGTEQGYDRFWETLKPTDQFCKIPINIARFRCPLRQEFEPEPTPATIKQDLQEMAAAAKEQISSVQAQLAPITASCEKLQVEVDRYQEVITAAETHRDQLQEDRNAVQQSHTLTIFRAEQAADGCKAIETLEQRQKALENQIEESKKRQDALQKRQLKQLADFSDLYESTLKAFLGQRIEATCRFTREEIDLKAEYHGELSSAAIDTLKTIAFDIAALRSGIHGATHHPRFIVFDSPREADMHPTPYQSIFNHLKSLEAGEPDCPFQVIITTTESPPAKLQKSPDLVLLLDASTKEGRLFKTDF